MMPSREPPISADMIFERFLSHRQPMKPTATDVIAQTASLGDIKAVIFDVYGTLVISGSGDVGSAETSKSSVSLAGVLSEAGIHISPQGKTLLTVETLHQSIAQLNDARRSESCPKPEVDIAEAWRSMLTGFVDESDRQSNRVVAAAAMHEAAANPTWPMPGATELLASLQSLDLKVGIVSNAQVFTPPLVADLLGDSDFSSEGFEPDLCFFSNRFRQAKPGPRLFDGLRESLSRHGIQPHQAVYVGNDMLNDVWAASMAGLKTAWFAGDGRSCRPRSDDPRCRSLRPDVVLTDLAQLLDCLHTV